MRKKINLYLASPLGFSEAGRMFLYEHIVPMIEECGCGIIDPWKLTSQSLIEEAREMPIGEERRLAWKRVNSVIGNNNALGIDEADGMVAVLDGTDVDSGTASEIGYAYAKLKPVIGYRNDFRQAGDNEGSIINLQVQYFIENSGGIILGALTDLPATIQRVFHSKKK